MQLAPLLDVFGNRGPAGLVLLGLSLITLGCNDKSICGDDEDCPALEVAAEARDAELIWDAASTFDATLEGQTSSTRVVGGGAVFTLAEPGCSAGCRYTLKSLSFELERMAFDTDGSGGRVIEALRVGIDPESGVSLPDPAGDYVIAEGTKTIGCASVDGESLASESKLETAAALVIDPVHETFIFEGELPFEFGAIPNRECVDYKLLLSGVVSARTPWQQHPGRDSEDTDPRAD